MSKSIKWTPSLPLKRPDKIISSDYSSLRTQPFRPSYEDDEVNMYYLLSMEYARIWFKEKETEKKIALSAQDNDFLVRRYVIRGLLVRKKEQEEHKRFIMKKFQNVPSRIKIRTKEELDKLMSSVTEDEKKEIEECAKTGKPL